MKADSYPLQVLLWTFSGWVNRHQQDAIAYLVEREPGPEGADEGSSAPPDRRAASATRAFDGFLMGYRFLICDRDSKFSEPFRRILQGAGVEVIRTPIQAPNCNADAERAHQGLGNDRIDKCKVAAEGEIRCRERLGGILKCYYRAAA